MTKNKKLKQGYESSIRKNISSGMLQKYGRFEDLKESFMTAYPIAGEERGVYNEICADATSGKKNKKMEAREKK